MYCKQTISNNLLPNLLRKNLDYIKGLLLEINQTRDTGITQIQTHLNNLTLEITTLKQQQHEVKNQLQVIHTLLLE